MQLKVSGTNGRSTVIEPGLTFRITDKKLASKELREELGEALMPVVAKLVTKITGVQMAIEDYTDSEKDGKAKA
jgi:hypothetical protein